MRRRLEENGLEAAGGGRNGTSVQEICQRRSLVGQNGATMATVPPCRAAAEESADIVAGHYRTAEHSD